METKLNREKTWPSRLAVCDWYSIRENETLPRWSSYATRRSMTSILQVEYRLTLLSVREKILQSLGHPVVSALGSRAARNLVFSSSQVGRGDRTWSGSARTTRACRSFSKSLAWSCHRDAIRPPRPGLIQADVNCPADDPPQWVRTVSQALAGIG
jgi:CheY-like chemotaxis protein